MKNKNTNKEDIKENKNIKELQDFQKKILYSTFIASGAVVSILGIIGIVSPDIYAIFLKIKSSNVQIYSTFIFLIGFTDIVIATILFKGRNRI